MSLKNKRAIDGVLLLDKVAGLSSNHALQQVKRLYQAQKAGHGGTLDPMATGMLPVFFGQATKFAQFSLGATKTYCAEVTLGTTTTTGDAEGDILETQEAFRVTKAQLMMALSNYQGEIIQLPPMYAAIKVAGKPLYTYARRQETVARQPRPVTIYALELLSFDGKQFQIQVCCSKGTYIRTLAEDIGKDLGVGAHLTALRRETVSPFHDYTQAISYEQLHALAADGFEQLDDRLLPIDRLLQSLPPVVLNAHQTQALLYGQALHLPEHAGQSLRVYGPEKQFLAHVVVDQAGVVVKRRCMTLPITGHC